MPSELLVQPNETKMETRTSLKRMAGRRTRVHMEGVHVKGSRQTVIPRTKTV